MDVIIEETNGDRFKNASALKKKNQAENKVFALLPLFVRILKNVCNL